MRLRSVRSHKQTADSRFLKKKRRPRSRDRGTNSPNVRPKIIAIVGATGSGKSALALRLAKKFGGVIISADSRQLYRGLDIGTAKPTKREQRLVPHYLIDVISPRQTYSAWQFQQAVYRIVKHLHTEKPGAPIFFVGGTYLYVDAVLKGWDFAQAQLNRGLRKRLLAMTPSSMFAELRKIDPNTAARIDRYNQRRLLRALEAVYTTGQSFYQTRSAKPPAWDILKFGLRVPQRKLDAQNRLRVDRMFKAGWPREVRQLAKKYSATAPGFLAHGYREVLALVRAKNPRELRLVEQTKRRIAINTRHHAKRQLVWFKKDPQVIWVRPNELTRAEKATRRFLRGGNLKEASRRQ